MMKRVFALFLFLLLLCGCTVSVLPNEAKAPAGGTAPAEMRGVWLSYSEWNPNRLHAKEAYCADLRARLQPLVGLGVTDLFAQVRPFGDAVYPTALFPSAACVASARGGALPFDFLAVLLETARPLGLRVHAWINPYRLSNDPAQRKSLENDPVVGAWLKEKTGDVVTLENGVFLNPASARVRALIVDGARELLTRYDLAGIHLDDYFYPTADASFDQADFDAYRKNGGKRSRASWRRAQVNALMRALFQVTKEKSAETLLTVSPAADIAKNETALFADVKRWCAEDGYCDRVMPQIYFGFQNEARPFDRCLAEWIDLCGGRAQRLWVGLAVYKIGADDPFAGVRGRNEWVDDPALLQKQVALLREKGCGGFCCFRLEFVNFHEKLCAKAFQNAPDVL